MPVLVKIHQTYREVVVVCDSDILGKKFEEDNMQLEVNKDFYGGEEMQENKIIELLKKKEQEDACFNFVGKKAVELGIRAGIIDKSRIIKIQGVPHGMALL